MTNEEMQNIIEFMIQRQEIFDANLGRLAANQEQLQVQVQGLATIVGQLAQAQTQTQNDLSHLTKIVTGLVELVTKDRKGDDQSGDKPV